MITPLSQPMEDKHIMDASIVASLQERDVFNDIAK
jgi:hypothetical protein